MSQIHISQYANQLNMANSDLIWVISSSFALSPSSSQFQYICQLKDGCGNVLTTIKQEPNPSGYGVFNMGRLVKQWLSFDADPNLFEGPAGVFQKNRETAKFFEVAFGEEWANNLTGSVIVYTGVGNNIASQVNPIVQYTGSIPYYYFINGMVDPNSGGWNWNTSSFYIPQTTPSTATFDFNVCLTDAPHTQSARVGDYLTVSALNGNILENTTTAQDIYAMQITAYDEADNILGQGTYPNIGNSSITTNGGPRTFDSQVWSSVYRIDRCGTPPINYQTSGSLLLQIPIGPQNITNLGDLDMTALNWSYYTVGFYAQEAADTINYNGVWDTFRINRATGNCAYNGVRFAFINDYGVWDWFTFTLANTNVYNVDRGIYKQNFVDYSTSNPTIPYNISRRGDNSYYTNIQQDFTVVSDWLTQDEANWLEQLFYSPNVYIQDGLEMVPIILTNTSVTTKTNPRTQKLFNYTVNYTLANNKRSR